MDDGKQKGIGKEEQLPPKGNAQTVKPIPSIVDPHLSTKNMEVHHHPDLHHNPKKWKEYFLEFLMIFLAVTMGFIAENVREDIKEHRAANVLAESLFQDLKKDTSSLRALIDFNGKKIEQSDVLIAMLHTSIKEWNDTSFYKNCRSLFVTIPFTSTDGTYSQMKTAGTLRYFSQSLVNLMNAYDVQLKKTAYRDEVVDKGTWLLGPIEFEIMNAEVIADMRFNRPIAHKMYLKLTDRNKIDKFINVVTTIQVFSTRSRQELSEQLRMAEQLLSTLKKDYDTQ